MINKVSEIFSKILRENDRNITEQRWNQVYKIAQNKKAEQVLESEKDYMESFSNRGGASWKMPEQKLLSGDNVVLEMSYYPGEVMATLKEKIQKWEDYLPLLQNVLELVTEIREKYESPVENNNKNEGNWLLVNIRKKYQNFSKKIKTNTLLKIHQKFPNVAKIVMRYKGMSIMEKDVVKRFWKYIVGAGVEVTKDNVLSILDKKEPRIKFSDFWNLVNVSLKNLEHFTAQNNDEYKLHWCLHLEHIRIDTDGKLVPIDFEHGAIYPRRHKYQDEAYIYQNLLQHFPDYKVANDFLALWLRSVNMEDKKERDLVKIALNEKILGGLYEMYATNPDKFERGIKQHMNFAKDFDKKVDEFRI